MSGIRFGGWRAGCKPRSSQRHDGTQVSSSEGAKPEAATRRGAIRRNGRGLRSALGCRRGDSDPLSGGRGSQRGHALAVPCGLLHSFGSGEGVQGSQLASASWGRRGSAREVRGTSRLRRRWKRISQLELFGAEATQGSGPGPVASAAGEASVSERIPGGTRSQDGLAGATEASAHRANAGTTAAQQAANLLLRRRGTPLQRRLVGAVYGSHGCFGARAVRDRQNDKRVTAAVTRYGYWRGVFFEGCEPRCGKGNQDPLVAGFGRPSMGTEPGNAANLVRLRGAINSRPLRGGNRRSGEKPQGRNVSAAWQQRAECRRKRRQGVNVRGRCRRRGTQRERIPREADRCGSVRCNSRRSEGSAKSMRDATCHSFE